MLAIPAHCLAHARPEQALLLGVVLTEGREKDENDRMGQNLVGAFRRSDHPCGALAAGTGSGCAAHVAGRSVDERSLDLVAARSDDRRGAGADGAGTARHFAPVPPRAREGLHHPAFGIRRHEYLHEGAGEHGAKMRGLASGADGQFNAHPARARGHHRGYQDHAARRGQYSADG